MFLDILSIPLKKILRELKSEAKFLESKISDLPIKEEQKEDKLKEIKKAEEGLLIILPKIDMMKEQSDKKRRMLNQIEEKMQQLNKLKQELRVKSNELQTGKNQSKQNGNQIQILDTQVKNLKTEVGDKKAEDVSKELQEKQSSLILEEKKSREVVDSISMLKAKHHQSGEVKEKILNLDHCPMCEQQVSHEHKRGITHREDEKIEKLKEQMQDYASRVSIIDKEMIKLKQIIEVLRKQESEFSVLNLKRRYIIEKEKSIKDLQEVNLRLEKEQGEIKIIIGDVEQQISKFEDIEDHYQQLKLELDSVLRDERNFAVEKTRIETGKKNMEEMLLLIDSEILSRLTDKEKLKKMKGMQMWMEDGFIPLMTTMEKHVMASIYSEFNELFQQWFSLLIEDASLNVRLDDRFTPVIDQNGYETAINHLSGGERTSAALAYRLALHKVVNDLMPHINTKDLIILDEPTDGFSDEQLDRVREVLNELSTHQTIIVSHESKIESFVDHVIRIEKHEHVSKVVLI